MKLKNMRRSEDTEQIHVCNWAMWNENRYPELKWLHHTPNGGSRNKAEAVKLKSMGVKSGVADLHLPYAKGVYIGLYIEMKYDKGRLQDSQVDFLRDMARNGHYVATCYTADDAIKVLEEYLTLGNLMEMTEDNDSVWKAGKVTGLKRREKKIWMDENERA
jgi:hypothetical protein